MCGSARASAAPVKHVGEQAPPCEQQRCSCGGTCAACAARAQAGRERAALLPGKELGAAWPRAYGTPAGGQQARTCSCFELGCLSVPLK